MTKRAGTKLIIHWSKSFQPGMAYVMLGRSQLLEDIYILESKDKFDPSSIKANSEALEENERIHEAFQAAKKEKESLFTNYFVISYLNVNRLLPHFIHIKEDHDLMKSDLLCLAETWLKPNETVEFKNYYGNFASIRNGQGLASFNKPEISVKIKNHIHQLFTAIHLEMDSIDVIFLYLSEGFEWIQLKKLLDLWIIDDRQVAVIGDTNIDYTTSSHKFIPYMESRNFTQIIQQPTHVLGGLIDQVFVNAPLLQKEPKITQRSVYYSDHDIVTLHIPKELK